MPFRFITKSIHTYLIDYPVAIVLMVAPFLLKLGKSSPVALWLSVVRVLRVVYLNAASTMLFLGSVGLEDLRRRVPR